MNLFTKSVTDGENKLTVTRVGKGGAAKSLQSCPTLCNPIDGSPPSSPIPGILQARVLEWVAIVFCDLVLYQSQFCFQAAGAAGSRPDELLIS